MIGAVHFRRTMIWLTAVATVVVLAASAGGAEPTPTSQPAEPTDPVTAWLHGESATGDWLGLRPKLEDMGLSFKASLTIDSSWNLQGGLDTADHAFRHRFDANLTLDTQKLVGWKGGTFFLDFYTINGDNGSAKLTGAVQAFDNIDAPGRTQVAELWYEQKLLDDCLRVKVGKIEANSEFAYVNNECRFLHCGSLHSSSGFSPTILDFPTYPDPAMGLVVYGYPTPWLQLGFGLFDGALQEGIATGSRGPATFFGEPADLFLIGELGLVWSLQQETLPGRLGVGGWGHTGTFDRFDGNAQNGTAGGFLVLSQTVYRMNPADKECDRGLALFAQYGWADPNVSRINHHVGLGAEWKGALPMRKNDVTGLYASWAVLTDRPGAGFTQRSEVALELFYKVQLTPWLSVKPDLQYLINPGGVGRNNALVATLRLEITF
jgi:porin